MQERTAAAAFLVGSLVVAFIFLHTDYSAALADAKALTAAVFFKDSVTETSLKQAYENAEKDAEKNTRKKRGVEKVRIFIVPGHDEQFPGAQYKNLPEREINLALGTALRDLLKKEPNFEVFLSQTSSGYDEKLTEYLTDHRDEILAFVEKQKGLMEKYVQRGRIARVVNVEHNIAPEAMALRLYGINHFANAERMDIVLHIHFNDYPGRPKGAPGKYSGFAVYVPERQYSNAKGSQSVAEAIRQRLAGLYPESDLPKERAGVVEDQELIALGSNNTLDGAGMLVEYGYIYEPAWANPETRDAVIDDLALQTYLGIKDFFEETEEAQPRTALLPYAWKHNLNENVDAKREVLSLQAALALEGIYPPPTKTKNDCGLTGFFGPCTKEAVRLFQEKHGIAPAEGFVGEKTRAQLHRIYD